ncbi:LPD38 domain-containing protein [Modicisalibacter sp. 'Wilcox']|uniref:LPD38 domain-containing protein n=1 Tax=Modicisalibacter sp. 'Wilcox' TaxID=2679914 RepID=UPI0013D0352E|nr:LPD38 domain-containing protein [Modicisalibacter sp. 'Wilcox']
MNAANDQQTATPTWKSITSRREFQSADPKTRDQIRSAFFDQVVAPRTPDNLVGEVRDKFLEATQPDVSGVPANDSQPADAGRGGAATWSAVRDSEDFQNADAEKRQRLRGEFFDQHVRNRLPADQLAAGLDRFMNATEQDVFGKTGAEPQKPETQGGDTEKAGEITASDYGREALEGGVSALASAGGGLGDFLRTTSGYVERGLRALGLGDAIDAGDQALGDMAPSDAFQAFEGWMRKGAQQIDAKQTQAFRQAMRDSTPSGDVFDPGSWKFGDNPSVAGYAGQLAGLVGQYAPQAAMLLAGTPERVATGMTLMGGLQAGGSQANDAESRIMGMDDEQLSASSGLYRDLKEGGLSPEEAKRQTAATAGGAAFMGGAPLGAAGGYLTHYVLGPLQRQITGGLAGRMFKSVGLEGAGEGAQEAAETISARASSNDATQGNQDLTEGTFADFALGSMFGVGAGSAGAAGGHLSSRAEPRTQERPADPQEADQPVTQGPDANPDPLVFENANVSRADWKRAWEQQAQQTSESEPLADARTEPDAARRAGDLIRTPRSELSSEDRRRRDSLTFGDGFKQLRSRAEAQGQDEAVALLDQASEDVSQAHEMETLARTNGEGEGAAQAVRDKLDVASRRFAEATALIDGTTAAAPSQQTMRQRQQATRGRAIGTAQRQAAGSGGDALQQASAGLRAEQMADETSRAEQAVVEPRQRVELEGRLQDATDNADRLEGLGISDREAQVRLRNMRGILRRAESAFDKRDFDQARRLLGRADIIRAAMDRRAAAQPEARGEEALPAQRRIEPTLDLQQSEAQASESSAKPESGPVYEQDSSGFRYVMRDASAPRWNSELGQSAADGEVGRIIGDVAGGRMTIRNAGVQQDYQGAGRATDAYADLADRATQQGRKLTSDVEVTLPAARVYDRLAARGYRVERNPTARIENVDGEEKWVADDGPVFTVSAPEPALQYRSNGQPFPTERHAMVSGAFQSARRRGETPAVVAVDGGFAVRPDTSTQQVSSPRAAQEETAAQSAPDIRMKSNGTPFATQRSAEISGPYRQAQRAGKPVRAVEVDGGWGVEIGRAESPREAQAYASPAKPRISQESARNETGRGQARTIERLGGARQGDTIRLTTDVGYARGGETYRVGRIQKDGSVRVTSTVRGSSTTLSSAELKAASGNGPVAERVDSEPQGQTSSRRDQGGEPASSTTPEAPDAADGEGQPDSASRFEPPNTLPGDALLGYFERQGEQHPDTPYDRFEGAGNKPEAVLDAYEEYFSEPAEEEAETIQAKAGVKDKELAAAYEKGRKGDEEASSEQPGDPEAGQSSQAPMLSIGEEESASPSPSAGEVTSALSGLNEFQGVNVIESPRDLPDHLIFGMALRGINPQQVRGMYDNGQLYVIAGNHDSVEEAVRTAVHEAVGHQGMRGVLGRRIEPTMAQLRRDIEKDPSNQRIVDRVRELYSHLDLDTPEGRRAYAEELVAHYAEEVSIDQRPALWKRAISRIRDMLRRVFPSVKWNADDVLDLIDRSRGWLRRGAGEELTSQEPGDSPRYGLSGNPATSPVGAYGDHDSTNFGLPDEKLTDAALRKFADKMRPLKQLQQAIKASGREIEEEADAYLAEELYHGKVEYDLRRLREGYVEPLAEGLAKTGISQQQLDEYLYARHAPERNAVVAERNPDNPDMADGGSGMTNAEAAEIIERVASSGKQADYDRLANLVYEMTRLRRDAIRDAGLEDSDVVDAWEAAYQFYVPLKGLAANEPGRPRTGRGFEIGGRESRAALGRKSRADSPSSQVIVDATESMIRRRKNEVGNALLSLITDHPNRQLWEVFTDDHPDTRRTEVRVKDPETGKTRIEAQERPVNMAGDNRYFKTKRAGRNYYIKIHDERLMNTMRNVGPETGNLIARFIGPATRTLASLVTSFNPEFMTTNFARDIQTALLNLSAEQSRDDGKIRSEKIVAQTFKDIGPAMKAAWRGLSNKNGKGEKAREWDRWFREFQQDGAKTGYFDMKDVHEQAKEIATLMRRASSGPKGGMLRFKHKTGEFVENMNGAVENAVRLSAYTNARRAGVSRSKAASLAKNMTVNFNRRGEVGTTLNALYMFANASIQGTANFARTMTGLKSAENGRGWNRLNRAQKLAVGMTAGAFVLGMLNRWLSEEDDDGVLFYDKIPDHEKERNLILMTGWATGEPGDYVKLPLPYGYNAFAVAGTHAEAVAQGAEQPVEAAKNLALAVVGSFSPIGFEDSDDAVNLMLKNLTPTLARSITHIGINEDFAGRSIYKKNFRTGTPKPQSSLSFRGTPEAYQQIAQFLNEVSGGSEYRSGKIDVSPDVLQHLVNFYGGGAWGFVEKSADYVKRKVEGEEVKRYRVPFAGRFMGDVSPYTDQETFYERRDRLGQVYEEATNRHGEGGAKFRAEHRNEIRLFLMAKSTAKTLQAMRKAKDRIRASTSLDDREKKARTDRLDEQMKQRIDRFNERYNTLLRETG